ncbi:MAG: hypothetical protein ACREL6_13675 [Gemmatimonadales bacterium]
MPWIFRRVAALLIGSAILAPALRAQTTFELFAGTSVSAPTPLTVTQEGEEDLHFTAHYSTRPFKDTPYYAARVGFWSGDRGWLIDFIHQKLYLEDPPAGIQGFNISNGFNILALSRGWKRGHLVLTLGAGVVITHPETRIRGRNIDPDRGFIWDGYFLSGGAVIGGINRRFPITGDFFLSLDGRMSASYVSVPTAGGHASVPNVAFHGHGGVGVSF